MTQIANVRRFNGTSDEIQLDSTTPWQSLSITALTMAAICKHDGAAGWHWVWSVEGTAVSGSEACLGRNGNLLAAYLWTQGGGGSSLTAPTDYFTSAMGWCLVAYTKADGVSTGTWHRYRYDTQAWDHTADDATGLDYLVATDSGAKVWLGTYDGASEWWDGDIAVAAMWHNTALSNAQLETLTDDITSWETLSPTGLWLLDQASTSTPVPDRIGSADQTAITGTTVVAESGLAFDVGGDVVAGYKRLYGPAQLTGSAADLYTCPASTKTRILHIHASNPSGSPVDVNLSIGADAAATRIWDDNAVRADGTKDDYTDYTLAAGEKIQGWAGSAATVNLTITGIEYPA